MPAIPASSPALVPALRARRLARIGFGMFAAMFAAGPVSAQPRDYYYGKLKITAQPVSIPVEQGRSATFSVTIGWDESGYWYGTPPKPPTPTYQWMKDGARIAGATLASLTIAPAQVADAGKYLVVITAADGWLASAEAVLTVTVPTLPVFLSQPLSLAVMEGRTATFEAVAAGDPAPAYQWHRNTIAIAGATSARLTIPEVAPADAGSYYVIASNSRGSAMSRNVSLSVVDGTMSLAKGPTALLAGPRNAAVAPGEPASFDVKAAGENLTFQWERNGVAIAGATGATHVIPRTAPSDMGIYSVVVSGNGGVVQSDAAILVVASSSPSQLANLSTRAFVAPGGAFTIGIALRGTGTKKALVRAIGPALGRLGVAGFLPQPRFDLVAAGENAPRFTQQGWTPGPALLDATARAGGFSLEPGSSDAATVASLTTSSNCNYTIRVTSADASSSGIALGEFYDVDENASTVRVAAMSALGPVSQGDRAFVPGFSIAGAASKRLLIRAIGPGLEQFGVAGVLADPKITIIPSAVNRPVAANDNWTSDVAAGANAVGAFALAPGSQDAALIVQLPPGAYTAIVAGAGEATGFVLFEIYDLDP